MPTALVTGTSTGIGAACVARLTADGWDVYAGVRRADDGDRLRRTHGGHVTPVVLEVTDPEAVRRRSTRSTRTSVHAASRAWPTTREWASAARSST